ncbi:MAG: glycosyltransferase family 39 protein [Scytolyngbya sp. HA4215-MV1]|jgi:uncharacterized membrane protein|nr:glycosyltransferase family 39 protein [Scytolyngbya sp. HA4215-MV1]
MKPLRPFLILLVAIAVGAGLRFWQLDAKPLWLDEVITTILSLGRGYTDVPLGVAFPLAMLEDLLTLRPGATCAEIVQTVSIQSVHPPLFFCWMHQWLNGLSAMPLSLPWKLRSLPALVGVGMIPAIFLLNRVAFSIRAGWLSAAILAVSPLAVYLSQEARHYTLPMLLITLALLGLVQIQQGLRRRQLQPGIWLGWMAVNSLGFYVHYFFLLAFVAQGVSLIWLVWRQHYDFSRRVWGAIALAIAGVYLSYLPWLPTLLGHLSRPESDWLNSTASGLSFLFVPLYQLSAGWMLMVMAFPVEGQPLWLAIPSVVVMLGVAGWLIRPIIVGMCALWCDRATHPTTFLLSTFIGVVLLEFLAIVYFLGKDITAVPRYHFVYYPAVCALLGASLVQEAGGRRQEVGGRRWEGKGAFFSGFTSRLVSPVGIILLVGLVSCGFVNADWVFQKPYMPRQVASQIRLERSPQLTIMGYEGLQDVALGLSFALEMQKLQNSAASSFAFLSRSQGYAPLWQNLSQLRSVDDAQPSATLPASAQDSPSAFPKSVGQPLNLWIMAPGIKRHDYPAQLSLPGFPMKSPQPLTCKIDPANYYRIGIPYQLYRCS